MRYMLLVCEEQSGEAIPADEMAALTTAWVNEMDSRGVRKLGQAHVTPV